MAKQTPEQEALDRQRIFENAGSVQQMKARRNADAYQQLQRETEASNALFPALDAHFVCVNSDNSDMLQANTRVAGPGLPCYAVQHLQVVVCVPDSAPG